MSILTLATADGANLPAHEAKPKTKPKGGLVMLHEAFGVTDHIKRVAADYAAQGYHVLAPEMFARAEPDPARRVLPYNKEGLERGRGYITSMPREAWLTDMDACVKHLQSLKLPVATIGYCWGGSLSYMAASRVPDVRACVCYYGGLLAELAEAMQPPCPAQFHLAQHDRYIPVVAAETALRHHLRGAEIHVYDADHGFNRDAGATYDATAASLARGRALDFLAKHLK